jgi:hypothetical protein
MGAYADARAMFTDAQLARADALIACAPPLTDEAVRAIRMLAAAPQPADVRRAQAALHAA